MHATDACKGQCFDCTSVYHGYVLLRTRAAYTALQYVRQLSHPQHTGDVLHDCWDNLIFVLLRCATV